jgi:short-subunit dehydrogenase
VRAGKRKRSRKRVNARPAGSSARRRALVALITGASSGIGRELAKVFAANGFDLVVVARRRDPLAALAKELARAHRSRVAVVSLDLTAEGAPRQLFDTIRRRALEIDVLVNNAGVAVFDRFLENDLDSQLDLVRLNVIAVTALTRLFVPTMVARGRGRVLNVASSAAFQPTPSLAVYGASKAFVLSLSESLAVELEGTGVTVTALCPGFTETPLMKEAERVLDKPRLVPSILMLDAAAVAREGYEACMAGTPVCINGLPYELTVYWERLQPRWLIRRMGSILSQRFRKAEPTARKSLRKRQPR